MNEQEKIYQEATQEPRITKQDLLKELKTALQDYFVAEVVSTSNELYLKFPNGQQFSLSVKER
jgi:hypothetical protein